MISLTAVSSRCEGVQRGTKDDKGAGKYLPISRWVDLHLWGWVCHDGEVSRSPIPLLAYVQRRMAALSGEEGRPVRCNCKRVGGLIPFIQVLM